MRLFMMLAVMGFVMFSSMSAEGALVFDFVPSSQAGYVDGVDFRKDGSDFTVTNTLVSEQGGNVSPIWIDFRVVFDHEDTDGNFFYKPNNLLYQVYVLDQYLTTPPGPTPNILVRDLMDGNSEVMNLGSGRYEYQARTVDGNIDFTFNTNLPIGYQVESGTFTYNGNATPEPASLALLGIGTVLSGLFYRKFM